MTATTEHTPSATDLEDKPPIDITTLSLDEKKELITEARSISSFETDASTLAAFPSYAGFTRTLHINATGIGLIRLPFPSRQLEIPITDDAGEVVYSSLRERVRSGNATLVDTKGRGLVRSEYFFGPGKQPKIYLLNDGEEQHEVKVQGKWTSRETRFTMPNGGGEFIWRYKREKDRQTGKKLTLLILESTSPSSDPISDSSSKSKKNSTKLRIAQLIRGEEARTPGTKRCDAGNGGELMVNEGVLKEVGIGEELVVASAIMMLKKEIDRRRTQQAIVLSAAISGGS